MLRVFISYAHADEALRQELDKHLASLKHQKIIEIWHDRRIAAGEEWENAIDQNSENADVVLLLVSSDFIASPYCYEKEMREAMRRHELRQSVVVPVILRPCDWHDLPFGKLQAATKDGRPITKFISLDEGFLEVVQSIRKIFNEGKVRGASIVADAYKIGDIAKEISTIGPRSSNLSVKKTFSDRERDEFRVMAIEYIAQFFENSLTELEQRNTQLKGLFRRRDSNSFEATVYKDGKQVTKCGIWLSGERHFGEIGFSRSGLGSGNSFNESVSVADDGQMLGLKPLGMGRFGGAEKSLFTLEGAADYLWETFIEPLQR
jgi:hypothetical protein